MGHKVRTPKPFGFANHGRSTVTQAGPVRRIQVRRSRRGYFALMMSGDSSEKNGSASKPGTDQPAEPDPDPTIDEGIGVLTSGSEGDGDLVADDGES